MITLNLLAQQTITLSRVLSALNPGTNIWAWMCYFVIIFDVAAMLLQKQGTLLLTVLMFSSIVSALINVLGANNLAPSGGASIFNDMLQSNTIRFGNWIITIVMLVFPLAFAGMTKTGRSRLPALLAAGFGFVYLFLRWLLVIFPRGA